MPPSDSPAERRTGIPSYNSQVTNGSVSHFRTSFQHTVSKHDQYSMIPVKAFRSTPESSSPLEPVASTTSSSPLTSPMASPRIDALEASLQNIATASLDVYISDKSPNQQIDGAMDTTEDHQESEYDCFNRHNMPRGHYFSVPTLYSRGVWVGYL